MSMYIIIKAAIILAILTFPVAVNSSWGFMAPYVASNLRLHDKSITIADVQMCLYMILSGCAIAGIFIKNLTERFD